jgi:hypothetical protein
MTDLGEFFLNTSDSAEKTQVVEAPAFSLTKVLAAAAVIITPLATLLVDQLSKVNLTGGNYAALVLGVLGFLAITASADVYSRAYATAAKDHATAATAAIGTLAAGTGHVVTFKKPLAAHRISDKKGVQDVVVEVLASAYVDGPRFLVKEDTSVSWLPASKVAIP